MYEIIGTTRQSGAMHSRLASLQKCYANLNPSAHLAIPAISGVFQNGSTYTKDEVHVWVTFPLQFVAVFQILWYFHHPSGPLDPPNGKGE